MGVYLRFVAVPVCNWKKPYGEIVKLFCMPVLRFTVYAFILVTVATIKFQDDWFENFNFCTSF